MSDPDNQRLDKQCRQLALDSFTAGSNYLTAIGEPPLGTLWTLARRVVAESRIPTGSAKLDDALADLKAFVEGGEKT